MSSALNAPADPHSETGDKRGYLTRLMGDDVFLRLGRNVAYLFSANALVTLLGFVTLTVLANAVGPVGLGVLAVVEAFTKAVQRLVQFEPWQAFIRYGSTALENGREESFERLLKASYLFEFAGGVTAGFVVIALSQWAAPVFGLSAVQSDMVSLYAATLFVSVSTTPTAILRIFDKFDLIAKFSVALALCRLLLTFIAWQIGVGLWSFVGIMVAYSTLSHVIPFYFAWRELRRHGHAKFMRVPLSGLFAENQGLRRFVWNSNVNVILRTATQRFDVLIVSATLGPGATGLYHLARRAGLSVMVVARPIQQAIYPDVARLWSRGEYRRFRRILLVTNALMSIVGLTGLIAATFFIDQLVALFFGSEFLPAAPLIIIQGLAIVLFLAGNTLNPALLSMGADRALVRVTLLALVGFFALIWPALMLFGGMGGVIAHVVFNTVWLTGAMTVFLRMTRLQIAVHGDG